MTKELKAAEKRFRIIHGKDPREHIQPTKRWPWPKKWALSGQPTRVYYASDRRKPTGKMVQYYHDHDDSVELWEPQGARAWGRPGNLKVYLPAVLTCLGYALGIDIKRLDRKYNFIECTKRDMICTNARGNMLVFVDLVKGPWAIIIGDKLEVGPYGIEH